MVFGVYAEETIGIREKGKTTISIPIPKRWHVTRKNGMNVEVYLKRTSEID